MAKGDDIQERLVRLGVSVVKICDRLPGNLLDDRSLDRIKEECTSLCRITAASIRTVKNRCAVEKKIPGI